MNMKKTLIATMLLFIFSSCDEFYSFNVFNTSDYPVTILSQNFTDLEATYNPQHNNHPGSCYQIAFPGEEVRIHSWSHWDDVAAHQDSGYVKIYILDTLTLKDTLCIYYMEPWSIRESNCMIYFPPTEAMRDFKMWPPYGTYDAHGNRVE